MKQTLKPGIKLEHRFTVPSSKTVPALYPETVGTHIDVSHEAATPPGLEVTASVELIAVEGRKLVFDVGDTVPGSRVALPSKVVVARHRSAHVMMPEGYAALSLQPFQDGR